MCGQFLSALLSKYTQRLTSTGPGTRSPASEAWITARVPGPASVLPPSACSPKQPEGSCPNLGQLQTLPAAPMSPSPVTRGTSQSGLPLPLPPDSVSPLACFGHFRCEALHWLFPLPRALFLQVCVPRLPISEGFPGTPYLKSPPILFSFSSWDTSPANI